MFRERKAAKIKIYPIEKIFPNTPYLIIGLIHDSNDENKRKYITVTLSESEFHKLLNVCISHNFIIGVYKKYIKNDKMLYDVILEKSAYSELVNPALKAYDWNTVTNVMKPIK